MPRIKKGTKKVIRPVTSERLQRLSNDTGIASEQLIKVATETLPFLPMSFVFEMRDGKDAKAAIMKMFDCATIGKGILEDIEDSLGVKGFLADDSNCEASVKSANDFRIWVHMDASVDRVPESIKLDEIDVDIDRSNVQVIYTRNFEKLDKTRKEHIEREISENQESHCGELAQYCENYELSFDEIGDEFSHLELTIQCEELGAAPKAEDVSKVFDNICG